jgi:hypothetical protein
VEREGSSDLVPEVSRGVLWGVLGGLGDTARHGILPRWMNSECRSRRAKLCTAWIYGVTSERRPVSRSRLRSSHTLSVSASVSLPPIPHHVRARQCSRLCPSPSHHHTTTPVRENLPPRSRYFLPFLPTYPHGLVGRRRRLGWVRWWGWGGGYYGPWTVTVLVRSLACYCFECLHGRRGVVGGVHRPSCCTVLCGKVTRRSTTPRTPRESMVDGGWWMLKPLPARPHGLVCLGPCRGHRFTVSCVIQYGLTSNVS